MCENPRKRRRKKKGVEEKGREAETEIQIHQTHRTHTQRPSCCPSLFLESIPLSFLASRTPTHRFLPLLSVSPAPDQVVLPSGMPQQSRQWDLFPHDPNQAVISRPITVLAFVCPAPFRHQVPRNRGSFVTYVLSESLLKTFL